MNRRNFMVGTFAAGAFASVRSSADAQTRPAGAPPVQILVCDTFGTVVDWRSGVIAEGQAVGRAKGVTVDWEAFADAWRGGYEPSMTRVRAGELPWIKLDRLHRMTLDELLVRFKVTGLTEAEKVHFNRAWHRLKPWPDSVAGLTRLKRKFVIAPLSNGNISLLTNMAKQAGLPWDAILSTEVIRRYKPDKETYLMAAELWDVTPGEVMMVAAHDQDLQSAKAAGLKTAYVHRPLEFGPARIPTPPPPGKYDYHASDFLDLAKQLGA